MRIYLLNYRLVSVLPCFSKILEGIMYNRVYNTLTENKFLYEEQFSFQFAHLKKQNMQSSNFLMQLQFF